ncbi:MAG TPA: glycerol-3-phosphate 1-O-acyltransferase PlsY [Chloroflexota bacterium]|nr:glycerol-3-phosphate 1-O-acyltransferase PlsY [Chloroflexota bacterium]
MADILFTLVFMTIGYLMGSIPTGYLLARARGVDIQKVGSGNIGATNILRTLGVVPAVIVALLDPLKSFLATLFPLLLGMSAWTVALTGFAAILGNNFNIFLRFKGGRGVATGLGVLLAIDPFISLLIVILGVSTMLLGRYVSLGSLVGVIAAPLLFLAKGNFMFPYFFLTLAIMLLVFYRHRENIKRLAAGVERRLGEKVKLEEKP